MLVDWLLVSWLVDYWDRRLLDWLRKQAFELVKMEISKNTESVYLLDCGLVEYQ